MIEPRFKMGSAELTLDLKEIMLNEEGYYKVSNKKTTEAFLISLYAFGSVGLAYTVWHLAMLVSNFI